jgi:hypothetical protein
MSYNSKTSKSTNIPKNTRNHTSNPRNIILIFNDILNQREQYLPQERPLLILIQSQEFSQILPNVTDIGEFLFFDDWFLLFGGSLGILEVLFGEPSESTGRQVAATAVGGVQVGTHLGHLRHRVHGTHLGHLGHHGGVHVHVHEV